MRGGAQVRGAAGQALKGQVAQPLSFLDGRQTLGPAKNLFQLWGWEAERRVGRCGVQLGWRAVCASVWTAAGPRGLMRMRGHLRDTWLPRVAHGAPCLRADGWLLLSPGWLCSDCPAPPPGGRPGRGGDTSRASRRLLLWHGCGAPAAGSRRCRVCSGVKQ